MNLKYLFCVSTICQSCSQNYPISSKQLLLVKMYTITVSFLVDLEGPDNKAVVAKQHIEPPKKKTHSYILE